MPSPWTRRPPRAAPRSLDDLDVEVVPVELSTATGSLLGLARRHGLTSCETACLGLAWFRGVPLATLDAGLRRTCGAEDVEIAS